MDYPVSEYKTAAAKTFAALLVSFSSWTNGWQIGNVFDTLTDYLLRFPDEEPSPNTVAKAALDRWNSVQASMCWYDDYGWWGIASAKAFDDRFANIFGPYQSAFQQIAVSCWNVMHTGKADRGSYTYRGGPSVWANRDESADPGYFTSTPGWASPRFDGGVWQYDLFAGERPSPPECTPNHVPGDDARKLSDPKSPSCPLGPYQLTVMNGLYLVLALRLAVAGKVPTAFEAAQLELGFLRQWFALAGDEGLLQVLPDGASLVRERVPTYAELAGSYPRVEGYDPASAWCGDQGLLLGGLTDKIGADPDDPQSPLDQARAVAIARGVLLNLTGDCGVLPYSSGFNDHGDPDDYSCGSGVFWRYLLRAFEESPAMRQAVLGVVAQDPSGNAVYQSAQRATDPNCVGGNELFSLFNALATLTAAIVVLGQPADGSETR